MTNIEKAFMIAEQAHINQKYDIYPYMYHIKMVVEFAIGFGFDESVIIGCILHDSMEDDSLSYKQIKNAFNVEVAEIVFAVTDELGRDGEERKLKTYPKIKENWKAVAVKLCDRCANMTHSREYTPEKFQEYINAYPAFRYGIHNELHPKGELSKAWNLLGTIMGRDVELG